MLPFRFFRTLFYLLSAFLLLCSHNLYIKMETYFLQPNQEATLSLYNGTFEMSENLITRDRMLDASVVAQGQRVALDSAQWKDLDSTLTQLPFRTGEAGTYVVGVSTRARNIELAADKFNSYLEHDGIVDMLAHRTQNNSLDQDAVESYEKHVKAIYQVGEVKTEDWGVVLGHPIELVPRANPYETHSGEKLAVQLLLGGKPLPNQWVYADYLPTIHAHTHGDEGHEHSHDHAAESHEHEHADDAHSHAHASATEEGHTHASAQQLRTDAQGIVTVNLPEEGIYYLRTIYMTEATDSDELTHRSKWATLTFEVSHAHAADTHTHAHAQEEEIPTWAFMIGSLLVIGLLFFAFRKKN